MKYIGTDHSARTQNFPRNEKFVSLFVFFRRFCARTKLKIPYSAIFLSRYLCFKYAEFRLNFSLYMLVWGDGVNLPNFQKGGLDRTLIFRGGLVGKRNDILEGGVAIFA